MAYVYFWHRCDRKGQFCNVTARGKMNSCRVEFADGFVMITSRNAIRKAKAPVLSGERLGNKSDPPLSKADVLRKLVFSADRKRAK